MGDATHDNEQGGFRLIEIIAPKYSGTKRVGRLHEVFLDRCKKVISKQARPAGLDSIVCHCGDRPHYYAITFCISE